MGWGGFDCDRHIDRFVADPPILNNHQMNKMKKNYTCKVKDRASIIMSRVLNFPEQVDKRMDGKACRVTLTSYTIKDSLGKSYQDQYKNDVHLQIKVIDVSDKEFLVVQSLLENLDEVVTVDE